MPWSGGTYTRTDGTRTGSNIFQQQSAAAIPITDTLMDTEAQDMATAINNTLTRDGQNSPTADLPMGSFKHTGVANASARTHYGVVGQIQDGSYLYAAGSGTDTITASLSPAVTAYANGMQVCIRAANANATTTPTLNLNGVGAVTITKVGGTALAVGDIVGSGHELLLRYNSTSTRFELLNPSSAVSASTASALTGISGNSFPVAPMGRLTLTSATPVLTSTTSGQTTIYYTPYVGSFVPIYDGTRWTWTPFSELSQTTTDSTKSPAAVANNSVYDMFVWNDSGTLRCTRGPAWSSTTSRGYTLTMQNGILLNTSAITNGPGASRGTYVGTVASNGSSQIDFILGGAGANGTAASLGVWNTYNRRRFAGIVSDTTDTWSYATATVRAANGSNTMRCTFVVGLAEDAFSASYGACFLCDNTRTANAGIGYDSTSALSGRANGITSASGTNIAVAAGAYSVQPAVGVHFFQACEVGPGAGTTTWYGDNAGTDKQQNGLSWEVFA